MTDLTETQTLLPVIEFPYMCLYETKFQWKNFNVNTAKQEK